MKLRTSWFTGVLLVATIFTFSQCDNPASVEQDQPFEIASGAVNGGNPNQTMSQEIPGQLIVVFKEGTSNSGMLARQLAQANQGEVLHTYDTVLQGFSMIVPAQAQQAVMQALSRNPNVASVEVDQVVTASATQSNATWGLDRIDQRSRPLNSTYNYEGNGSGVKVYILDTGLNYSHVDFGGRTQFGYSAFGDNGYDGNGHGTHVAGTVGGNTWGVAKGVTLVSVKVLSDSGSGSWSGVIAGIDWVAKNKGSQPAVINMSLGGGAYSVLDTAVQNAINAGVTVVVAAGNSNANACNYSPARAVNAITVGSTTNTDARSSFSNFGTCVDLFAPGTSITSAWYTSNTATTTISGTSMASPHVAGVAALYLGANPTMTPAQVDNAIKADATPNVVTSAGTGSPNRLLYSLNANNGGGGTEPPPATPTLTTSTSSLSFGSINTGTTRTLSYTLSGSNLSTNVSISAPSGYQVSLSSSRGFANSISVSPSSGAVNRTIYVRFAPTAAQNYDGSVTNSSNGATSVSVQVSGSAVSPSLSVSTNSLSFGSVTTSSNDVQSYTLTGSNLTGSVSISAPSGFQVSTSSTSGFSSSISVAPSSGSVNTIIYVRFAPTAAQNYSGNVTNSSSGATSAIVQVSGTGQAPVINITLTGSAQKDNRGRWRALLSWTGITTSQVDLYMSNTSTSLGSRVARVSTTGSGSYTYSMNTTGSGTRHFRACNSGSTTQCSPVLSLTW